MPSLVGSEMCIRDSDRVVRDERLNRHGVTDHHDDLYG